FKVSSSIELLCYKSATTPSRGTLAAISKTRQLKHFYTSTAVFIATIFLALTAVISCMAPKSVSTIESNSYDDKTNLTTFNKFPFGSISIPGKWTEVSYNKVSGQHNFKNTDSILTAVAINRASSYSFYKPNMTANNIVKEFYEWDSKYLADNINGNRTIIKQDTVNHFIVWQITADNEKYKIDNHYLFGSENGIIFTVFISTKKWSNEQKTDFVQTVYKNKTVGTCCN
ncbi:MAG TPA: hypothetical protein VII99_12495, partial [Bacteroidia bacterium]